MDCNTCFVNFDFKTLFYFILYFFLMETKKMFILYNDIMNVVLHFHRLKCDSILDCLLMHFNN
jgi:hypothetical protein